jgi:hypothetical protein
VRDPERPARVLLAESSGLLSLLATRALYDEQPELWRLGENGRARTLEDFGHHFRALATLQREVFEAHVVYCYELFAARGFPLRWLSDAWRHMEAVIPRELPAAAAEPALVILREVTGPAGPPAGP